MIQMEVWQKELVSQKNPERRFKNNSLYAITYTFMHEYMCSILASVFLTKWTDYWKQPQFKSAIIHYNICMSFGSFQWYILLILCKTRVNASKRNTLYILIPYIKSIFHCESFWDNKSYQHLLCVQLTYVNYFTHTIFLTEMPLHSSLNSMEFVFF